jgi:hypothetical protein
VTEKKDTVISLEDWHKAVSKLTDYPSFKKVETAWQPKSTNGWVPDEPLFCVNCTHFGPENTCRAEMADLVTGNRVSKSLDAGYVRANLCGPIPIYYKMKDLSDAG